MNRIIVIALLAAGVVVLSSACQRARGTRRLVISEAVHFELQPGAGTLDLPVFAGTMGVEQIVRDVSQAEFYYQKLSAVYGPKSFHFLADSTVELLLDRPESLHTSQPVYGFDNGDSRIDLSLVSFDKDVAHYEFRVTDKKTGQVRNHAVDVPAGQSASIGMLFDPVQNRGHLVCIAVQALGIDKNLTPSMLADFLRQKNRPRGVNSPSGFRPGDQKWMDDIFGPRGTRLATETDSAKGDVSEGFDRPPELLGGSESGLAHVKYPESALRDSLEGKVIVETKIDERGLVSDCHVVLSVRADLDSAAVDAVRTSRFKPASSQGKPVGATVRIPIAFKLK